MSEAEAASSSYVPDKESAERLVQEFADITGTDTACAQFYLQDRNWDLERSLNAYYEVKKTGGLHILQDGDDDEPQVVLNITKSVADFMENATTKPPSEFRFITWNLDGLDERNLKIRTKAFVRIVQAHRPDIVFLQEVIPKTLDYIEKNLLEYKCIAGGHDEYFTVTLINQFTVYYDTHKIIDFPTSQMMRNLLQVEVHIGTMKLILLNSHLESTADHAAERVKQLTTSFKAMIDAPEDRNVILAGDLNLRDKEVDLVGGLPAGVEDVWISCGSRKECQYTWDTLRNNNCEFAGRFKPRMRFDRVYFRSSHPQSARPKYFGLLGLQKIAGYQCFPSDHWGIMVDFDIKSS